MLRCPEAQQRGEACSASEGSGRIGSRLRLTTLQRVVSELNRFKFRRRPHLQMKFSGNVEQLENARIEATLRCERFQRGNYQIRDLALVGEYSDQTLSVRQCE